MGAVSGAQIRTYLLERSRVSTVAEGERAYHVFYQLLTGAPSDLLAQLKLSSSLKDYSLLTQSSCIVADGIDDKAEYAALIDGMEQCGIRGEARTEVFTVVSAILHMANCTFADDGSGYAKEPPAGSGLGIAQDLLGCELAANLISKVSLSLEARSSTTHRPPPSHCLRTLPPGRRSASAAGQVSPRSSRSQKPRTHATPSAR